MDVGKSITQGVSQSFSGEGEGQRTGKRGVVSFPSSIASAPHSAVLSDRPCVDQLYCVYMRTADAMDPF